MTRKVKKSKNAQNEYVVFDDEGSRLYSFYFYREMSQKFGPIATSYLIDNDGKKWDVSYSYFADMKRDAESGWLEIGRVRPAIVSLD
jgi:hypothetical protein